MSLLDAAISFYRRHNGSEQYRNDSAETTIVEEGRSQLFNITVACKN